MAGREGHPGRERARPDDRGADTDIVIRVTSSGLCGSDLHLYEVLAPFMEPGDIVGHEPMGVVEAVGSAVHHLDVGDRVVIPFNVSCGHCWMCERNLQSQCETTQNTEHGTGATLLGYSKLYGQLARRPGRVPPGAARRLRPGEGLEGPPDDRFLFLSDVLPTAWQAVEYADVPDDGTLLVAGSRPDRRHGRPRSRCTAGTASSSPTWSASGWSRVEARGAEAIDIDAARRTGLGEEVAVTGPQAAAPTPSSTRSGWRPTARSASSWPRGSSGCCPTPSPSRWR